MRLLFKLFALVFALIFFATVVFAKDPKYTAFTVKVVGKGQPMLLLPGATCSGEVWNETVARYSKTYQCHVFTLAGYAGATPLAQGPYLETIKKQLEEYISDQQLDKVILVGHSIGGFLSLCIASEIKDHLEKVVVLDALPFLAASFNPNAVDTFSEPMARAGYNRLSKLTDSGMKAQQMATAKNLCRESARWDQIATWGVLSDKKTMAYAMSEMMGLDMRKKVNNIQVPVLVLVAYNEDRTRPQITRDYITNLYSGQYTNCKTCTVHVAAEKTKHFIMYDAPEWYYSEVDNFLGK